MAVTINAIFTETVGSPVITKNQGAREVVRKYTFDSPYLPLIEATPTTYLPSIGDEVTGSGFVSDYSINQSPGYSTLVVKFLDRLDMPNLIIHANNTIQYELSINFIEKALETKVDSNGAITYLKKWNYNLYQMVADKDASTTAIPAWFDTAHDESDADGVTWAWAKIRSGDPKSGVWKLASYSGSTGKMIKPGIESYLVAQPVITAKGYFTTRNDAVSFLMTAIGLKDPSYRFGFAASGTSPVCHKWLAMPMGIVSDGKMWIAQNQYQFADKWDADLYAVLT